MRTTIVKPEAPSWLVIDAAGQTLGRLAAQIAHTLRGKHNVTWSPNQLQNNHVVVVNAAAIVLCGDKAERKEYIRHSGTFGHLKRIPFSRLFAQDSTEALRRAVRGMLPRNRLRERMARNLHIYAGAEHPHGSAMPQARNPATPQP